jgi:flagellar hook-basal body complex protein FliE
MAMTSIDSTRIMQMRTTILEQNSALQKAAGIGGGAAAPGDTQGPAGSGFGDALKSALNQVNAMQDQANNMSAAYERGDVTDIAAVMLSRQQASIGFEATLQVRNKLLSAYKDIMSMPV